jgi:hypothetical protein
MEDGVTIIRIVLRLIHIGSAFVWVGLGLATVFYIAPAATKAGEGGLRFLKTLLTRTPYPRAFPMFAGLTMLAGILLYLVADSASFFTRTGNMVLGMGALAGILAGIHGGAVTGRATKALGEALVKHVPDGAQSIPQDAMATLNDLSAKLLSHSRVSFILMVIALLGMGLARYLP